MAKIRFQKSDVEKYLKIDESVIEKMSMFGTPTELFDDELEVEIFPNRPDLISLPGFMRAFKAFMGKELGLKQYKINKPEKNYLVKVDSSLKDVRPFTACAVVKNLKLDDNRIKVIIDLQEKLHSTVGRNRKKLAIGIYPLDKITLPIKFEARKPEEIKFIPLESNVEMNGLQILQRHPTGRDYAHLLEGKAKFPIFVDSKGEILSMPPIINSNKTGKVELSTKEVFVECSGFHLDTLKTTLNIVVTTLAEMGGSIYSMDVEYGSTKVITPDLTPQKMKISLENANKILGLNLKEKDLEKLLPKMGYDYSNGSVRIPAWRSDILHEVDIIEDIAIAYGYENIVPEIPKVATMGEESVESKVNSKIAETLAGLGLIEISSYHLIKIDEAKISKIDENKRIELENSKTEYKLLRPSLLIPALRTFSENKDNEYPQKIFEIGTVFNLDAKSESGINESTNLLITSSPANFTELKQILEYLTYSLNKTYTIKDATHPLLIEGRTGEILFNNKRIGYIGEVHPETLKSWGIKMPVAILEISLEEFYN
jgi:phenylalanyl-tRNA synthetase beta chain